MRGADEGVLIGRDAIAARVAALGDAITSDFRPLLEGARRGEGAPSGGGLSGGGEERRVGGPDDSLVLIPILTGAMVFTADLVRRIPLRLSIRPVTLSSYRGQTTAPGAMIDGGDIPTDLGQRHVLVVDDILDTGRTLAYLRDAIVRQKPASLRICVLLRKTKDRDRQVEADYHGFDIPDEFVIGYGLDYDGFERNRPDIIALRPRTPRTPPQGSKGGAL